MKMVWKKLHCIFQTDRKCSDLTYTLRLTHLLNILNISIFRTDIPVNQYLVLCYILFYNYLNYYHLVMKCHPSHAKNNALAVLMSHCVFNSRVSIWAAMCFLFVLVLDPAAAVVVITSGVYKREPPTHQSWKQPFPFKRKQGWIRQRPALCEISHSSIRNNTIWILCVLVKSLSDFDTKRYKHSRAVVLRLVVIKKIQSCYLIKQCSNLQLKLALSRNQALQSPLSAKLPVYTDQLQRNNIL